MIGKPGLHWRTMATQPLLSRSSFGVRKSLAEKLLAARKLTGLSTRAVAKALAPQYSISHASIANYEQGRTFPPTDVLAALAIIYGRPINWFLEHGESLTGVQFRNLKSRVRVSELHVFEANAKRWIDAYVAIENRLKRCLASQLKIKRRMSGIDAGDFAREVRSQLGINEGDQISSVVEVLERYGIRVIENSTPLMIDGMAARYGDQYVVVLNPQVSNDRIRLNAAHELGHVLMGDCDSDERSQKVREDRAFEFASQLLLPNAQLKKAFEGSSMVRLVQFKERFGISLAAMVYRAEKLGFITKSLAKTLWIEFARRGWKTREPGQVRPDRATRFEQLIEEAITSNQMSLREIADLAGVRVEEIRSRIDLALGLATAMIDCEESAGIVKFPT